MMYDGHMHGFFGGFMWLFWIVVIIVVIWLITATVGSRPVEKRKSALDVLEERYARGEIEREEFEQKRKDLKGGG